MWQRYPNSCYSPWCRLFFLAFDFGSSMWWNIFLCFLYRKIITESLCSSSLHDTPAKYALWLAKHFQRIYSKDIGICEVNDSQLKTLWIVVVFFFFLYFDYTSPGMKETTNRKLYNNNQNKTRLFTVLNSEKKNILM